MSGECFLALLLSPRPQRSTFSLCLFTANGLAQCVAGISADELQYE